jgi:hypothetical protein
MSGRTDDTAGLEAKALMVPRGCERPHDLGCVQHFMAERMKARVHSRNTDHTPLASEPESVVGVIAEAADAVV